MSSEQIKWAMNHDWYLTTHYNGNGLGVIDAVMVIDHDTLDISIFSDYHELRKWAGY